MHSLETSSDSCGFARRLEEEQARVGPAPLQMDVVGSCTVCLRAEDAIWDCWLMPAKYMEASRKHLKIRKGILGGGNTWV